MPDIVLKKVNRPALVRAGIKGKTVGWGSTLSKGKNWPEIYRVLADLAR